MESVLRAVRSSQGIIYPALLNKVRGLTADDLNYLISRGRLYADLRNEVLADPDGVHLSVSVESADAQTFETALVGATRGRVTISERIRDDQ